MTVSFKGLPLPVIESGDKANDMKSLGNVITRLLRARATAIKNSKKET